MIRVIKGSKSRDVYTFDTEKMIVSDKIGNTIRIFENIDNISDNNLRIYADSLFHDFYKIANEFKHICEYDNKQGNSIQWEEWKS